MTPPHLSVSRAQGWCFLWTACTWASSLLWGVKLWRQGLRGSFLAGLGLELEMKMGPLRSPGFFSGPGRGSESECRD